MCVGICAWNPVNCLCAKFRNFSTPSTPATESYCSDPLPSAKPLWSVQWKSINVSIFKLSIGILQYKILARIYPKLLQGAASEDGRVVYHAISPWSIPCKTLYGFHDPVKQGWNDGIITKALRELSANCPTSPRWMILDGYLHADLVCQLHTLLDASRKLTLPSGEILQVLNFSFWTLQIEVSPVNLGDCRSLTRCASFSKLAT